MNTFITSILKWKKSNRKDNADMNHTKNVYDDGNIPEVDLPKDKESDSRYCTDKAVTPAEPLPESTRPRKDGPGGD